MAWREGAGAGSGPSGPDRDFPWNARENNSSLSLWWSSPWLGRVSMQWSAWSLSWWGCGHTSYSYSPCQPVYQIRRENIRVPTALGRNIPESFLWLMPSVWWLWIVNIFCREWNIDLSGLYTGTILRSSPCKHKLTENTHLTNLTRCELVHSLEFLCKYLIMRHHRAHTALVTTWPHLHSVSPASHVSVFIFFRTVFNCSISGPHSSLELCKLLFRPLATSKLRSDNVC